VGLLLFPGCCSLFTRCLLVVHSLSFTFVSSSKTVKIVDRSWRIFNDKGRIAVEVPRSPGLVGLTPTLAPGGTFEYYSGTDLESDRGHMEGSFGVVVVEGGGDKFDAVVPRLDFRSDR